MELKNETHIGFKSEIRIVPQWAWALAAIAFAAAQWYFNLVLPHQKDAPPAWACALLGLLAGVAAACYLLFIGYINRDAKRRGMSPTLWTIVAIVIPNALGILLYFVLRQPVRGACPQCGYGVQSAFNFCPRCSYKLSPNCPQCQKPVSLADVYCPFCGSSLRASAPVPPTGATPPSVPTPHT